MAAFRPRSQGWQCRTKGVGRVQRLIGDRRRETFMDAQVIASLAAMLRTAAGSRTLVPYKRLHAKFDKCIPLALRYDALETAASTLADLRTLDYGVLLTLDNGLPGDDFFMRLKRFRRDEYETVMGYSSPGRSIIRRRIIAFPERERVFEHASTSNGRTSTPLTHVQEHCSHISPRGVTEYVTLRRQAY